MEGAAEEVISRTCVSMRYLAKVAALSELPRAHVMTPRGARARSASPSVRSGAAFAASWRRTAAGLSAASACMRLRAFAATSGNGAELGDEVVDVAAVVGLRELDRAAVDVEPETLDEQAG